MESDVSQAILGNATNNSQDAKIISSPTSPNKLSSNPTNTIEEVPATNIPMVIPVIYSAEARNFDNVVNPMTTVRNKSATTLDADPSRISPIQNSLDIPFPLENIINVETTDQEAANVEVSKVEHLNSSAHSSIFPKQISVKSEPRTKKASGFEPLLSWLKSNLGELQTQVITIGPTTHLQIWPSSLELSQLQLLPPFYLKAFVESATGDDSCGFDLRLVTFHGRVLKTQSVKSSPPYHSDLLANLNSYKVCCGYSDSSDDFQISDLLVEYVGEQIVVRNRQCSYVVQGEKRCTFCEASKKRRVGKSSQAKREIRTKATELLSSGSFEEDPFLRSDSENCLETEDQSRLSESDGDYIDDEDSYKREYSELSEDEFKESDENEAPRKRRRGRPPKSRDIKGVRLKPAANKEGDRKRLGKTGKLKGKEKASKEVEHRCGQCGKLYKSIYPYYKHVKKCAEGGANHVADRGGDRAAGEGGGVSLAEGKVIDEKCKLCLRHFNRQWQLDRHYKLHEQRFQMDEKVSCPSCQAKFSKLELNAHFQTAHEPDNGCCTECFLVIPAEKLCRHLEIAHFYNMGNKLCPLCGEKFNYPHQLKTHMEMVHEKEDTSVVCDYCGKLYPHKFKLKKHINMIHFDNKGPQTCKTCGKVFATTAGLYKHVKVHSVVKPFQCGLCNFRSLRPGNVKAHVKSVHKRDSPQDHVVKVAEYAYNDGLPMQKQGGPALQET